MSSVGSVVESFFRRVPTVPVPIQAARQRLTVNDVPFNDEGIRQLAADGSWRAAAQLAESLEKMQVDSASRAVNISLSLKYLLVRVTSHCKMGEYGQALHLIQQLGDLFDAKYTNAAGKSLVPFSLLYFDAVIPQYLGNPDASQVLLYKLLELCETKLKVLKEDDKLNSAELLRWRERLRRVRRGLVCNHCDMQQDTLALSHLSKLMDSATDVNKQILLMQQVGCLALRCGNLLLAQDVFRKIEKLSLDDDEATSETLSFRKFIVEMDRAFVLVFCARYNEAVEMFRKLMMLDPYSHAPANGPNCLAAESRLNIAAANAFIVCHLYATHDESQFNVNNAVSSMESLIKQMPRQMLQLDAVLLCTRELYRQEGDDSIDKAGVLNQVVEVFRCGSEAIPRP